MNKTPPIPIPPAVRNYGFQRDKKEININVKAAVKSPKKLNSVFSVSLWLDKCL